MIPLLKQWYQRRVLGCLHALGDPFDYGLSGLGALHDAVLDVSSDNLHALVSYLAFHGCEPGDLQQGVEVALAHLQLVHNEPREIVSL